MVATRNTVPLVMLPSSGVTGQVGPRIRCLKCAATHGAAKRRASGAGTGAPRQNPSRGSTGGWSTGNPAEYPSSVTIESAQIKPSTVNGIR
jgi:hypothetical protein